MSEDGRGAQALPSYNPHETERKAWGKTPGHSGFLDWRQATFAVVIAALFGTAAVATVFHLVKPSNQLAAIAQPSQQFDLNFPTGGIVTQVLVQPGQYVHQGQVLAEQDSSLISLTLVADQATLASDKARLTADQSQGQLVKEQQGSSVSLTAATTQKRDQAEAAAAAVAADQLKLEQQRLADDQRTLAVDQQSQTALCAQPSSAGCRNAQQEVGNDANRVNLDQSAVQAAEESVSSANQLQAADSVVSSSQAALTQAKADTATDPTQLAATLAADDANVARDEAQVAKDQLNLKYLSIVAPAAGYISSVAGVAGEYVDSAGVEQYPGPTSYTHSSSSFNLLPSAPSSNSSNTGEFRPVVVMYAVSNWTAVSEISESSIPTISKEVLRVQIPSLGSQWYRATFDYVVGQSVVDGYGVDAGSPAHYDFVVSLPLAPQGLLPGMRARSAYSK